MVESINNFIRKDADMSLNKEIEIEVSAAEVQDIPEVVPAGPYCNIPKDYYAKLLYLQQRNSQNRQLFTITAFDGRSVLSVLI